MYNLEHDYKDFVEMVAKSPILQKLWNDSIPLREKLKEQFIISSEIIVEYRNTKGELIPSLTTHEKKGFNILYKDRVDYANISEDKMHKAIEIFALSRIVGQYWNEFLSKYAKPVKTQFTITPKKTNHNQFAINSTYKSGLIELNGTLYEIWVEKQKVNAILTMWFIDTKGIINHLDLQIPINNINSFITNIRNQTWEEMESDFKQFEVKPIGVYASYPLNIYPDYPDYYDLGFYLKAILILEQKHGFKKFERTRFGLNEIKE